MSILDLDKCERDIIATAAECPNYFPDMAEILTVSDFENANHRIIWGTIEALHAEGKLDKLASVKVQLRKNDQFDVAQFIEDELEYVGVQFVWKPSAARMKEARKERFLKEQLARAIADIDEGHGVEVVAERLAAITEMATATEGQKPLMGIKDLAILGFETMQARLSKKELPVPLPASWGAYKAIMRGGLWPGLHILVAGTGAGKTTFATQIAIEAASQGHPTAYIGLELDETQIGLRLLGAQAGIEWSKLYLGEYSPEELTKTMGAIATIESGKWPLFADFGATSGWPASRLKSIAKELQRQSKAGKNPLIILDFLQLVGAESGERLELRERVGKAAYMCRQIAKDYKAAVIVVSSSSRVNYALLGGTSDDNKGPAFYLEKGIGRMRNPDALVGTGKESGEIEYAADSVTVLVKDQDFKGDWPGFYVAVPKLRYGRPGYCSMTMRQCRFEEIGTQEPTKKSAGNGRASQRSGPKQETNGAIDPFGDD